MPCELANGGPSRWDQIREEVADLDLAGYRHFVPNLTSDNMAPFFYQTVGHRPTAELDFERVAAARP